MEISLAITAKVAILDNGQNLLKFDSNQKLDLVSLKFIFQIMTRKSKEVGFEIGYIGLGIYLYFN